jgi:hypothetical protein
MDALLISAPSGEHTNIAAQIAVERRLTDGSGLRAKPKGNASDCCGQK